MSDHLDNGPIACSLTTQEFRDRETTLLARFRSAVIEAEELEQGYSFRLPGDDRMIRLVAELMVAERECCPFLTFEVIALPNMGLVTVRATGPAGSKEFLKAILCEPGLVPITQEGDPLPEGSISSPHRGWLKPLAFRRSMFVEVSEGDETSAD